MLVVVLTPISAIFGLSTLGTAQVVEVALLSIAPLFICEAVKLITSLFKKK